MLTQHTVCRKTVFFFEFFQCAFRFGVEFAVHFSAIVSAPLQVLLHVHHFHPAVSPSESSRFLVRLPKYVPQNMDRRADRDELI